MRSHETRPTTELPRAPLTAEGASLALVAALLAGACDDWTIAIVVPGAPRRPSLAAKLRPAAPGLRSTPLRKRLLYLRKC